MATTSPAYSEIAAVDLGSNSFRLQLAKIVDGHLIFHDSLRETVRLGAGLGKDKRLDEDAQRRAIDCLKRFGERLRGLPPQAVRAVATNTFRVAKNAPQLLKEAEDALGFPIEIIAGREEARMIFVGVSHYLPPVSHKRLVVDIGGGSTEFIVGQGLEPIQMESLYMGCVSYSLRFFPEGRLDEENFIKAELAAATEIQGIRKNFTAVKWQEAVGSSGTARALGEIIRLNGLSDGEITDDGLQFIREQLVKVKDVKKIELAGVSADRATVLPGGLSIMIAAFKELGIKRMTAADTALREGVLYELLGRISEQDTRETTVSSFMRRYHVDGTQAKRVQKLALNLLKQVASHVQMDAEKARQYLIWAAKLHEIGISIAHSGYHKHSAYVVENADMPGFSKKDQEMLGFLLRAQRRSLAKLNRPVSGDESLLLLIMRLAVLFHRSRQDEAQPKLKLSLSENAFSLKVQEGWLANNPLTDAELRSEVDYWKEIGITLAVA